MKARFILGVILAATLVGGVVYFYGGSQVPPGQPPLQSLTAENISAVKEAFNAASGEVRVLVLLSPT
jgi:hypothetical protein